MLTPLVETQAVETNRNLQTRGFVQRVVSIHPSLSVGLLDHRYWKTMQTYPFRLGTTSYVIPADILPNARYLAGKVRDIELILFEVDDGPNNLPSPEVIEEL